MLEIGIADKTTLDSVNTKVGTNADAAGTSTLFARLAQIAAYVDTLETLIGTANPASGGTDTLFKYLKKIFDGNIQPGKFATAEFYQSSPTTNTWYTALDVTSGVGVLNRISLFGNITNTNAATLDVRITIDGTDVTTVDIVNASFARGLGGCKSSERSRYVDVITNIRFDSSLKVEVRATSTTAPSSLSCVVDYGLI